MSTIQVIGYLVLLAVVLALFVFARRLESESKRDSLDLANSIREHFDTPVPKKKPLHSWVDYYGDLVFLFEESALKKHGEDAMEDGRTFREHLEEIKARHFDDYIRGKHR